nr:hypothetical protein [Bacillus velezensis]
MKIDKSLYLAKDTVQFKSNRTPVARNQQKSELKNHFTEMQLKQIIKGKTKRVYVASPSK